MNTTTVDTFLAAFAGSLAAWIVVMGIMRLFDWIESWQRRRRHDAVARFGRKTGVCLVALLAPQLAWAGGWCYKGAYHGHVVTSYAAPIYTPAYHAPAYYQKEYVPYVLEVQVHKDRYYSLSDLYRDRLYLETFDLLRELRGRAASDGAGAGQTASAAAPTSPAGPVAAATGPAPPRPRASYGRTSPAALKVLTESCLACHGAGNEHLDLSKPDAVPPMLRWAAFGMAGSQDMPKPAPALLAKGKEEELATWRAENALKEEAMKALYEGWVKPAQVAAAKK